jgi:hypothetical protein
MARGALMPRLVVDSLHVIITFRSELLQTGASLVGFFMAACQLCNSLRVERFGGGCFSPKHNILIVVVGAVSNFGMLLRVQK